LRVPLFAKKLDFGVKGVYGDGIGRFGSSQLADATARPDGTLAPIRTGHGLGISSSTQRRSWTFTATGERSTPARAAYAGYETVKVTQILSPEVALARLSRPPRLWRASTISTAAMAIEPRTTLVAAWNSRPQTSSRQTPGKLRWRRAHCHRRYPRLLAQALPGSKGGFRWGMTYLT